jgi:hypothetical protein
MISYGKMNCTCTVERFVSFINTGEKADVGLAEEIANKTEPDVLRLCDIR